MFSLHTTPEEFKYAAITGHFRFVFERKTRSGKSHDYRDVIVFEKLRFQNVFRPHENAKTAFSNSSGLKRRFRKAPFSKCFPSTLKRKAGVFKVLQFE